MQVIRKSGITHRHNAEDATARRAKVNSHIVIDAMRLRCEHDCGTPAGMHELDTFEAVAGRRRSIRAFRPEPVARSIIARAVAAAMTTPSSCNTQPWRLHIVSGAALDRLRAALQAAAQAGTPREPDIEYAMAYAGVFRERQIDAAVRLFAAQGVARQDRGARTASALRNYRFFDAPHAAFLFIPADGGLREAADCAMFAQTFMLALAAAGVGSCAQGSLGDYPMIVRRTVPLEESGRLLLGISFGYADLDDPAAQVRTPRREQGDVAIYHDG